MNALQVCERLEEWLCRHPRVIDAARFEDPLAAEGAARSIREHLDRLGSGDETPTPKRVDATVRAILDALLEFPALGPQLPPEFNEYLRDGSDKANPAEHRDARDRLYRAFEPIVQKLDPHVVPRPKSKEPRSVKPADRPEGRR